MTIRRRRSISDPSWLLDDFEGMVFSGLEHACLYCTVRIEFPNVVLEPPAATSNSPTRGQVKFPHLTAADGAMITR